MITSLDWEEYRDYLSELTQEELEVELEWLESVGQAKKRGSVVSCIENYTIQ
jgi:hypothetical protein